MQINAFAVVLTRVGQTLVRLLLAALTRVSFGTVTQILVDVVFTGAAIQTGVGRTLVHI